jgi:hypothetical protein
MQSGEIYRIPDFYLDPDTGELRSKYLLVLAIYPHGDLVARLLTSRRHGRPENPACFQGTPYPGFFLGVPGAPLTEPTWIDLRAFEDIDGLDMANRIAHGATLTLSLPQRLLMDVMVCVAGADDTTRGQEEALRDALAKMRAP